MSENFHNKKMKNKVQREELEVKTIPWFRWQRLQQRLLRQTRDNDSGIPSARRRVMTLWGISILQIRAFLVLFFSACVNFCDQVWCYFSGLFLSCSPIALSAFLVSKMSTSACKSSILKFWLWWTEVIEITQTRTACNLFLVVCIDGTTHYVIEWSRNVMTACIILREKKLEFSWSWLSSTIAPWLMLIHILGHIFSIVLGSYWHA